MKARLVIDTKPEVSVELSADELYSLVSSLSDSEDNAKAFGALAAHPASAVRERVASKDKLPEEVAQTLLEDPAVSVLRSAVRSEAVRNCASTAQLVAAIGRDAEAAESIAGWIESYAKADADETAEALMTHPDPRVRGALASNTSAPKKWIRTLLKDTDAGVRHSAKSSLE